MKNKDQYNQPSSTGEIPVTKPEQATTRTSTDIKISQLEDLITSQHNQITKLRRDISRLKADMSDVITILRNRG